MKNYVVTGATSGLGLEAVQALASLDRSCRILVGARSPEKAEALKQAVPADQLWISTLDTSSVRSVERFGQAVLEHLAGAPISGLALNAGVQFVNDTPLTEDGYDVTFATNVLGHAKLVEALAPALTQEAVVVSTASGTHDDRNKLAKRSGFRGSFFPSADAVARGDVSDAANERQRGMDRYATSKLCNVMYTYAMARRHADAGPRFIALDPGMMPGTGLARDHSKAAQLAWKTIMPKAVRLMPGASTPQRSGKVLSDLLRQDLLPTGTGLHVEYSRKEIRSSELSYSQPKQDDLIAFLDAASPVSCAA